jgi:hypothetical protein
MYVVVVGCFYINIVIAYCVIGNNFQVIAGSYYLFCDKI